MASATDFVVGVVEDDSSVRKALARLLAALGYRTETFATAAEFMRAAASTNARCIIVDVDLGGSSGLNLARELSSAGFDFPIIFMTGSHHHLVETRCTELGCVAFLRKPFCENQLIAAIARALPPTPCVETAAHDKELLSA